ncbi:MAG: hypothetical protein OXC60_02845 [Litoreibacter sp.]|nr:hypothetical protein [Litoreibacter sp.]MCY4333592.1 hypothetical protein [Litoreibacter sp.]
MIKHTYRHAKGPTGSAQAEFVEITLWIEPKRVGEDTSFEDLSNTPGVNTEWMLGLGSGAMRAASELGDAPYHISVIQIRFLEVDASPSAFEAAGYGCVKAALSPQ